MYIGCPSLIRSDCGTENTSLAACHMSLRHNHIDAFSGERSYRFGKSTSNTVEYNNLYNYAVYAIIMVKWSL